MDIATEEVGHVEMIATMVARLLEGAPATATTKAAAADPVVGAVLGGMDPQQAIVAGGGRCCAGRGRTRLVVFMLPTCSRG
jgi:Mn-containing catalase